MYFFCFLCLCMLSYVLGILSYLLGILSNVLANTAYFLGPKYCIVFCPIA